VEENANCIFKIASNFVIHPQILIFLVFKIANISPILITNKIFHVTDLLHIYFAINLWHQKFVTADVTAVFVNSEDKILIKVCICRGTQQRG